VKNNKNLPATATGRFSPSSKGGSLTLLFSSQKYYGILAKKLLINNLTILTLNFFEVK
jgi:hypothetical protein